MNNRIKIFCLIAALFFSSASYAATLDENRQAFDNAGELYKKGEYEKALETYLSIEKDGYISLPFDSMGYPYTVFAKVNLSEIDENTSPRIYGGQDRACPRIHFVHMGKELHLFPLFQCLGGHIPVFSCRCRSFRAALFLRQELRAEEGFVFRGGFLLPFHDIVGCFFICPEIGI